MHRPRTADASCLTLRGDIRNATVEKFHYAIPMTSLPHSKLENNRWLWHNVSYERWTVPAAQIDLRSQTGSAIVIGSNAELMVPSAAVLGVAKDPLVKAPGNTMLHSMSAQPDEIGSQRLKGHMLVHQTGGAQGRLEAFHLYWYQAALQLTNQTGTHRLLAHTWEEGVPPMARLRHVLWFELNAQGSELQLDQCDRASSILFSRAASFHNVSRIAFDYASSISGSLPDGAETNGTSLWMAGTFEGSTRPEAVGPGGEVHMTVSGDAAAYSLAGGDVVPLGAIVVPISLAGLGLLAAYKAKHALGLLGRLILPLYTKLKKDRLLDVETRDTIYRLIQQTPGINFLALHQHVKNVDGSGPIAFGALAYHLSQMERFHLIVSKREGRYRRYFDVAANMGADTARVALLQTQPVPAIARAILDHPSQNQAGLHARIGPQLGITRQALAYHLRRLEAKELVRREPEGRFSRYVPTERLQRLASYLVEPPTLASDISATPPPAAA